MITGKKKKSISKFLTTFKQIATTGRGIDIVSRGKNLRSLAELGITKRNCIDEILSLSVADYCEGPEPDTDRPGEIWKFGKHIGDKEVYIKLKIARVAKKTIAKCLSFHIAEYSLCFPFKEDLETGGRKK
ncbi:MAG: hypothetical protein LWX52_14580 [Deltaproteobacteria bacterium]|nr:hypothetical protein [Deltaproteobacteria bacterium]